MTRKYESANPKGRYGREEARENIYEDEPHDSGGTFGKTATVYGDAIGMSAEELLEFAREKLREEHQMVDKLLRHVPRKHEDKVDDLRKPRHETERAIIAAGILIGNARKPLESKKEPNDAA